MHENGRKVRKMHLTSKKKSCRIALRSKWNDGFVVPFSVSGDFVLFVFFMQSLLQEKEGWSKAMTSEILRNEECNPNLLKKKGLELLDAGKTNEAVECFSKGLVYAPFDSLMRFWRGRKLIGREEYTQSASDLKLAALENPEDWECWYYLGVACYLGGMYEEAKVAHANSKTLMKKYGVNALPATTDWYWMICMKLGQPEEAAKALEDITPDTPTEDGDYLCRVLLYKGVLKPETSWRNARRIARIPNARAFTT